MLLFGGRSFRRTEFERLFRCDLIETLAKSAPKCDLLVTSTSADGNLILRSMRAGAKEFLTQPLQAQDLAAALQRSGEFVARYGGEEFIALLPGADLDEACEAAERLRQAVLDLEIPHAAGETGPVVSMSAGVSAAVPTSEGIPALLVTAADSALYAAKKAGRNRVGRPEEVMLVE